MGLDITAYASYTKLNEPPKPGDYDAVEWGKYLHVETYKQFADHAAPLAAGDWIDIRYVDTYEFRAGSYGGYNYWRDTLSKSFIGVPAEAVWENPEPYKDRPFYELVNFSDCEGVIGPDASERLRKAFFEHWDKARELKHNNFILYKDFTAAFTIAAGTGFVEFC